jgi:hypothetical protein
MSLMASASALTGLLAKPPGGSVVMPFAVFAGEARQRFYYVDVELKKLALEIAELSKPLDHLV